MSKRIRLQDFASDEVVKFLLDTYKEVKKSRNINDILLFKGFITRIMDAQEEYEGNGEKKWTTLDNYVRSCVWHDMRLDGKTSIDVIKSLAEHGAFNYKGIKCYV